MGKCVTGVIVKQGKKRTRQRRAQRYGEDDVK
jgi:hypothetical protein